ncbi:MAG TPA: HD domain-containing protein [Candidatus Saccharimonadales bacterium]|nr:HD domain-containing protein [Candidatus Saccharimonadales bacterium]
MKKPSLDRLLDLQRFLYLFRNIKRMTHFPNTDAENDVEHSYSLAMTAWYLASFFPELHKDTVIRYALVHDLVEVHAGDTYIYADEQTLASKHKREFEAYEQIKSDWADFPDLAETIAAYEARKSPEAAFVYALDKIMPIMLIYIGEGYTWKTENITLEMLHMQKKDKVALSPEVYGYYEKLYELLKQSPHLIPLRRPS